MPKKQTEAYIDERMSKECPTLKRIGPYKGMKKPMLVLCDPCGYKWSPRPDNILNRGQGCPKCANVSRSSANTFTKKEVIERLAKERPDIIMVGEYKGMLTQTEFKHKICGNIWSPIQNNILNFGTGCPACYRVAKSISRTLTQNQVVEKLAQISDDIIMIGEYKGMKIKTWFKNKKCGHKWGTLPSNVFLGHGCPQCAISARTSTKKEAIEKLAQISPDIIMVGEYKTVATKTEFKHKICGHEWKSTTNNILKGNSCPQCNESKGEKKASSVLNSLKIEQINQQTFPGCRNPKTARPLFFDFYLPKLNICIEFDGYQHFEPEYWRYKTKKQAEKIFQGIKDRDRFKTKFCKSNRIKLIRIPYWEFKNIEQILRKELRT